MEKTKVVIAQSKSRSLRTTIPVGIARQFDITDESELTWEIEAKDNELRIVVRPLNPSSKTSGKRMENHG
jgi:bifunctional DNA-binding transcriptional regulator/antitoxin component of YhaV-PrlF toxin-antitoxin module